MENDIRYAWTVSVIAMLDRDEEGGKLVQWEAYTEFEESITSIQKPSKDINFAIYLYDVKDKKAYIKTSEIIDGRYYLNIVNDTELESFYSNDFALIISFLENYVAQKELPNNIVRKHLLITWGHAAGAGFYSMVTDPSLKKVLGKKLDDYKTEFDEYSNLLKSVRFVKSHLAFLEEQISLTKTVESPEFFLNKLNFTDDEKNAIINTSHAKIKCLTALKLGEIINTGLKFDATFKTEGKIDYLLCVSCFTQMIETGDILSSVVKVMIAPVTTISFFAYNYKNLFKVITEHPSACDHLIANQVINNYLGKYAENPIARYVSNEQIFSVQYRQMVSISAINLKIYSSVKTAIKIFVDFVLNPGNKIRLFNEFAFSISTVAALKHARERCLETTFGEIDGSGIIDFSNLIMKFFSFYNSADLGHNNPAKKVLNTVHGSYYSQDYSKTLIIAQYYPGYYTYYFSDTTKLIMSQAAGAFGIFLPPAQEPYLQPSPLTAHQQRVLQILDIENLDTGFWRETGWKELMTAIRKRNNPTQE